MEEVAGEESEVSEWGLRERREREEEREAVAVVLGARDEAGDGEEPSCSFHRAPPVHGIGWRGVGGGHASFGSFLFVISFVISLVRNHLFSRDRPGRRAKGELATSRCADCGEETDCKYSSP